MTETTFAGTRKTAAYECQFTALSSRDKSYLRLKQYPADNQSSDLGKIDVMIAGEVQESTLTKIYQIPLYQSDVYIQIWYAADARVDAQFSTNGLNQKVPATYSKGPLQREMVCTNFY